MSGFKVHDDNYPHFVTIATVQWMTLFLRHEYTKIVLDSLRFCQKEKGLRIHAYVIMPDHLHLILSAIELARVIGLFKSFTAREIIAQLKADNSRLYLWLAEDAARKAGEGEHRIWQDGFHPEQVHTKPFFEQKLAYIHDNPVRRGLVSMPSHWLHSSAAFYYDGLESVLEVAPIEW
jgi:putative transposase